MDKHKRNRKDKDRKRKSSVKNQEKTVKMFPYPSTAAIKKMSEKELADLILYFTFSKMRQDFNI